MPHFAVFDLGSALFDFVPLNRMLCLCELIVILFLFFSSFKSIFFFLKMSFRVHTGLKSP